MTTNELREKTMADLGQQLRFLLRQQFVLRVQASVEKVAANHQHKNLRRSIARVKTIISEKKGQQS